MWVREKFIKVIVRQPVRELTAPFWCFNFLYGVVQVFSPVEETVKAFESAVVTMPPLISSLALTQE